MFSHKYLSKSLVCIPLRMRHQWKVRILPKTYDDYETPYMKVAKPKRHFVIDFLAFLHRKNYTYAEYLNYRKWKVFTDVQEDQRF